MARNTRQGDVVRQTLQAAKRPLTPAEANAQARETLPNLGLATTYRHIRALATEGLVVGVDYPGHPIRYEWADGREKHHFSCRRCGKLFALDAHQPTEPPPKEKLKIPSGYLVEGAELILYGSCPACSA